MAPHCLVSVGAPRARLRQAEPRPSRGPPARRRDASDLLTGGLDRPRGRDHGGAEGRRASDTVECRGVAGDNLAARALAEFRSRAGRRAAAARDRDREAHPGGRRPRWRQRRRRRHAPHRQPARRRSARAGGARSGSPPGLGSDVPAQLEPGHALVQGTGERDRARERAALLRRPAAGPQRPLGGRRLQRARPAGGRRAASSTRSRSAASPPRRSPRSPPRSTTTFSRPPSRCGPSSASDSTRSPPRAPSGPRSAGRGRPASDSSRTGRAPRRPRRSSRAHS